MMHAIVISAHYTSVCYCIYCSDERKLATLSVQLSKMNSSSEHSFKTKEVGVGMVIFCCNFLIFDTRMSLECVGTLFTILPGYGELPLPSRLAMLVGSSRG